MRYLIGYLLLIFPKGEIMLTLQNKSFINAVLGICATVTKVSKRVRCNPARYRSRGCNCQYQNFPGSYAARGCSVREALGKVGKLAKVESWIDQARELMK